MHYQANYSDGCLPSLPRPINCAPSSRMPIQVLDGLSCIGRHDTNHVESASALLHGHGRGKRGYIGKVCDKRTLHRVLKNALNLSSADTLLSTCELATTINVCSVRCGGLISHGMIAVALIESSSGVGLHEDKAGVDRSARGYDTTN